MKTYFCSLKSIEAHCIVGLYDFERVHFQKLLFDLSYTYNRSESHADFDLADTPDYVQVGESLKAFVKKEKFFLLETLLDKSCDYLLENFPSIQSIELTVFKPAAEPTHSGPQIFFKKNRK